jgi:DNA replication protein DnaC
MARLSYRKAFEILHALESQAKVISISPGKRAPGEVKQPPSAYCYGPTGSGKTRSTFLKLRQFMVEGGEDVAYIRGKSFGDEVVERTRPGGIGGFKNWFDHLLNTDVLALDECDKISFSPRVMAEFFELIEHRTSNQSVTIFVAQCSVDRLAAKMGTKNKEEAAGIVRRLRENCLPIHFNKPNS